MILNFTTFIYALIEPTDECIYETREFETREYETREYETREYETCGYETRKYETREFETHSAVKRPNAV